MMRARSLLFVALFVGACGGTASNEVATSSGQPGSAEVQIGANASGKIEGSGATFPQNQYDDWFRSFTEMNTESDAVTSGASHAQFHSSNANSSLVLGYTGGGSGAGITNFYGPTRTSPAQMFSGSDMVLTAEQRSAIAATEISSGYSVIPAITGPISVVYRLDGLKTTGGMTATLRLDGPTVCGIYLGTIQRWNAPEIHALNPLVANLPDATINVVARSDGSGTTFVFSSYLGRAAAPAQKGCGYHGNFGASEANLDDPVGAFAPDKTDPGTHFAGVRAANAAPPITGKPGNGGVAAYVQATNLTISYVESSYASEYGLAEAALAAKTARNGGAVYLKPTTASVTAALKSAAVSEDPVNPSAGFVHPIFAEGVNAYPIVGYSWWLIYHDYTGARGTTLGQVQGMIAFMRWALSEGQRPIYLYRGYTPVPEVARANAMAELRKITFDGVAVWP